MTAAEHTHNAEKVALTEDESYVIVQPKGYFLAASGDTLPWFDQEGRAIVLLCHLDGSVTWQLRSKDGTVLEPSPTDGIAPSAPDAEPAPTTRDRRWTQADMTADEYATMRDLIADADQMGGE